MAHSTFERNPRDGANFLSVMLLSWMNGLLTLGNKRPLNEDDLFPVLDDCKAELLLSKAESNWLKEKEQYQLNGRKPRLWKAILRMVPFKACLLMIVLKLLQSVTFVLLPVCLWLFLKTLNDDQNVNYASVFSYVALLGIIGVVKTFSFQHYDYITELWGLRLKVATIGLVYKKIIALNRQRLEETLSGNTINLVSNDAQKLEKSLNRLGLVLSSPLEISFEMFILWSLIGWQALVGSGLFFLTVTLSLLMVSKAAKLTKKAAEITDQRLGVMKELITGIRALKLHAWEFNYRDIVSDLRRKEMRIFRQKGIIVSGFLVFVLVMLSLSMLISITALVLSGTALTSFMVFTLLSGLTVLRFVFCVSLGREVLVVAESKVALDRIQSFIMDEESKETLRQIKASQPLGDQNVEVNSIRKDEATEELDISTSNPRLDLSYPDPLICVHNVTLDTSKYSVSATAERVESDKTQNNDSAKNEVYVSIADACCSWATESSKQTLYRVSLEAPKSHMVAITGAVGSGKSSLLMAVLGEIPLSKGSISSHGKIAFVPQIPWIFSGTIRENILFGLPYIDTKFQHVVDTCNLRKDLADFSSGDQTEIGQRGVKLSGGQKARVSLARALYSEADIYLLDDPLSALDAKVGRTLFETCILGTLSDSIRFLVTHQLQYLKDIDHIVVMENGSIKHQGRYSELKNSALFSRILELSATEDEAVACKSHSEEYVTREERSRSALSLTPSLVCGSLELSDSPPLDLREEEEGKTAGTVSWRVYWKYFREGLPAVLVVLLVVLLLFSQVCVLAPNWWLARITSMPPDQQRYRMDLAIYACLVAVSLLVATGVYYFFYYTVLKASENLHNKMATAIIKAPVLFFDRNPAGRILNRFSKDLGCMDDVLPPQFQVAVFLCLNTVSSILVPVATNYWLFLVLALIISLFVYFVRYYVKTSRELKRIEAIRCSPVYSHIAETLSGLEVVHSSNMQSAFLDRMNRYQDDNTQAFFLVVSSARWLGIRLDLLSSVFVTTVGIGAVLVASNPALAGLALTYALQTIDDTQYGLRLASEVENLMTSVERVITYTKLDPEPGYSSKTLPPENWPREGTLEVHNLSLEYIEGGPRVLRNINVFVPCKQKVGVVGRTGAGKSSVVSALFRMPEPMGKVLVDGVDIGGLHLQAARKSMAVITQDPVIFSGSVRRNLDPFSKYREEELWIALEEVQLKHLVQNMPGQLDFQLKECGTNFSVGERQLVCLARALLERSKIIIMDEATANVDFKTDRLIQEVIRNNFRDSTVLTIAHRLNTIIDYDKVLVLDDGQVMEFDKPETLLSKTNGFFAELVRSHVQN